MNKNNSIKEIIEQIEKSKNPLFICHENPDGDTYGAAFALRSGMGAKESMIACASKVEWPFDNLGIDGTVHAISGINNDLYVFLDCADEFRCGEGIKNNLKPEVTTINIDHHQSNTYYADYNYVIERSSTSELVFDILMEGKKQISKKTADYLYMGVASDSGLFVHGYTTSETHLTAAKLLEFGADFEKIGELLFRTISKGRAYLTGRLFNNLEIINEIVAISYISQKDFYECNAEYNDSEGLISSLDSIEGMQICILLKQIDEMTFKASMRSSRDYDISKLAIANGGGGHKQAAGCRFSGEIEEIKARIMIQIEELKII